MVRRYHRVIDAAKPFWCDGPRFSTKESTTSGGSEAKSQILQPFGSLRPVRLGLTPETRSRSVRALNRLLAHAMALRDLYKKAHWQTSGAAFYGLHLMFDRHYESQLELIDSPAERVQLLGGHASGVRSTPTFFLNGRIVDVS